MIRIILSILSMAAVVVPILAVAVPAERDDAVFGCTFPGIESDLSDCRAYGRFDFSAFRGTEWVSAKNEDHLRVVCKGSDPGGDDVIIYNDGVRYRYSSAASDQTPLIGADFSALGAATPLIHIIDWNRVTGRGSFSASISMEIGDQSESRSGTCEFLHPAH